jgi:hypothetical protein
MNERVLERKKKRNAWVNRKNRRFWEERVLENSFSVIQNIFNLEEHTNLFKGKFLESLYEFFKINLCCCNILKIENILIKKHYVSSFSTKHSLKKYEGFFYFFNFIFLLQSSTSLQTHKQKLREDVTFTTTQ